MPYAKLKPGPRPTSCLTCRRRRKKCDLARPRCERCIKGGFECLGYGNDESCEKVRQEEPNGPTSSLFHSGLPVVLEPMETPELADLCASDPGHGQQLYFHNEDHGYLDRTCANREVNSSLYGSTILFTMTRPVPCIREDYTGTRSPEDSNYPRSQNQSQLTYGLLGRYNSSTIEPCDKAFDAQPSGNRLSTTIRALFTSIPPSVDATHIMRDVHIVRVIGEYQTERVNYWFASPPSSLRDSLMARLNGSKAIVKALDLGVKLLQAVSQEPRGTGVLKCVSWIDKLEQRLESDFHDSATLSAAGDCLLAELELAFLKSSIISSMSGYVTLQKALPRFLHLLAANPDLYAENRGGNLVVSFPRTFSAPQHELKRFVMFDTAAALVLGVPPLVEYGYDGECDAASHGLECIHGVPVVFVETISQVNSWRAGSIVALDDWQILEKRVMSWEAQPLVMHGEEASIQNVARVTVQESWRQVALIYIYMGMCGVSSHDARVQTSIRHIIRLGDIVAKLPIGVHMFAPYVVAGLGARYEKHRSIVREKLLSYEGLRVWLFRGSDFSRILEHLWHGAGAGGVPVMWIDYVQSRRAVAPV
ncbi:unnamed protein product [Rhizoctonia solani]|uniref:Zn(2)-C6 fungal-type domain-containing protein n=1 Tax=Rhizoctonia solani TaxID=456999 RepID=A0A8H3GI52_9AGAM|nr:unnamed protein product [Rhizoctonia solani]